ncbi:MAG: MFS transporter [Clostridiales bacterium]|jgi:OPA family glycerol-3-phosphate transporter-like MFS transporter|nr:MFS transporter [Clostridiales bacterium]
METKFKKSPYILFALCFTAYAVSYITKLCFSISMAGMIDRGYITLAFGGGIGTGFLFCYGCGQFINGRLGDKINPKYMVGFGLLISALCNFGMAFTENRYLLLAIWCINGFGCSMLWAPVLRCISEYLPEDVKIKAGTYVSATIPAGTLAAYGLGGIFLDLSSYRGLFVCAGIIGLTMAVIWFYGFTRLEGYIAFARENFSSRRNDGSNEKKVKFLPLLFTTGAVFAVGCILFNGVLKDGVTLWLPSYLNDFFGVSDSTASVILIILPVINLLGAFFAVRLNSKIIKNEFATAFVMFTISLLGIVMLFLFGKYSVILAALLVSVFTSTMLGANTMLLTFVPMNFAVVGRASTLTGMLDAFSYLASAVSAVTIGVVAEKYGWSVTILSWGGVAFGGLVISAFAIPFWKKGRKLLDYYGKL